MAVIIGADGHQYLTVRVLQCRVLRSVERCNAESRVSHAVVHVLAYDNRPLLVCPRLLLRACCC